MSASRACARDGREMGWNGFLFLLWVLVCDLRVLEAVGRKELQIASRPDRPSAADSGRESAASESASRACARDGREMGWNGFLFLLWVLVCDLRVLEAVGRKELQIASRPDRPSAADSGRESA